MIATNFGSRWLGDEPVESSASEGLSAFDTANVVNEISEHVEREASVAHDEAYHLTAEWL